MYCVQDFYFYRDNDAVFLLFLGYLGVRVLISPTVNTVMRGGSAIGIISEYK